MNAHQKILVFCLPGIGDALLFTPSFRALKRAMPEARVTALVMFAGARDLLERNPHVDEVLHFDFLHAGLMRSSRFVWQLRRRHFDVSILGYPSNRLEYNLMAWLVGAPRRLGHRYRQRDWVCGNWLNTQSVEEDDGLSNIEENLRLVSRVTGLLAADPHIHFKLDETARHFAVRWLTERGLAGKTLAGFHPGGSTAKNHRNKRWPAGKYVELGQRLSKECGVTVLVFGGPEETAFCKGIAEGIGFGATAVRTEGIVNCGALINACAHFVSSDSALMHLAGALGVPTTGIFGPTSAPWVRIPGASREEVTLGLACQPCFRYSPRHLRCRHGDYRCLRDLSVEDVAKRVRHSLGRDHAIPNAAWGTNPSVYEAQEA